MRLWCACQGVCVEIYKSFFCSLSGFSKKLNLVIFSALGVSGGPDSMALCVLAADWKIHGLNSATKESSEFINGILAIVVDHGLRAESENEAKIVRRRVLNMGINTFSVVFWFWISFALLHFYLTYWAIDG